MCDEGGEQACGDGRCPRGAEREARRQHQEEAGGQHGQYRAGRRPAPRRTMPKDQRRRLEPDEDEDHVDSDGQQAFMALKEALVKAPSGSS